LEGAGDEFREIVAQFAQFKLGDDEVFSTKRLKDKLK